MCESVKRGTGRNLRSEAENSNTRKLLDIEDDYEYCDDEYDYEDGYDGFYDRGGEKYDYNDYEDGFLMTMTAECGQF